MDKGKCNNNNLFEDKENLCAAASDSGGNSAPKLDKCNCHRSQQQQQQISGIEVPVAEKSSHGDETGSISTVVNLQGETTNDITRFNGSDGNTLRSTAFTTHSAPISNRTSVNNSTDNLSYNSDNYYVDELIVLQNTLSDEEVSLNSDDCIYAYRGGAEFDIALEPTRNNNEDVEDETDFLEMDFDPDPLSEVDPSMELLSLQYPPSMLLTSSVSVGETNVQPERQLFSSPTDGGNTTLSHRCPTNKEFAKLSLDLTNIRSDSIEGDDGRISPITVSSTADDSRPKATCSKPKRITERSISMTKNRKTQFLYSKLNKNAGTSVSLCSAGSLDERAGVAGFPPLHSANAYTQQDLSDETCSDCLEKEFLANTIGKPIQWSDCLKCKNKRSLNMMSTLGDHCTGSGSSRSSSYTGIGMNSSNNVLCSAKPPPSSMSFDLKELLPTTKQKSSYYIAADSGGGSGTESIAGCSGLNRKAIVFREGKKLTHKNYQRGSSCDNIDGQKLSKRSSDQISTKFFTLNADEETIVQALEKLHIPFDKHLITSYFQRNSPEFKNIKHFIIHQSKKNCNYPKLMKIIEVACNGKVNVEFQPDKQLSDKELVQDVLVADILHYWTRTNNIELLKQLDKRFEENNVLGKIIYVIRQAQQRNNAKPLAEYISIPQYYQTGYISIVTKK